MNDWDPQLDLVRNDPKAVLDDMRRRCPVAHSRVLGWSVFRHADVLRVLEDHATFSNEVSAHRSVPNGMDPPEHTLYRRAIEPYFSEERMRAFESDCRTIASKLIHPLAARGSFECIEEFAVPFALQCQCRFVGWPVSLAGRIRDWTRRNEKAARAGDRTVLAELACEFRRHVDELLRERRSQSPDASRDDVIDGLLRTRIREAPLADEDIASILRNWTAGELGSLAAGVGIITAYLAEHPDFQDRLRSELSLVPAAIEEILRISGPLSLNRRVTTRDVELHGRQIRAGERISIMWTAANRDEQAFENPDTLRLDRPPGRNLLFGAGIHVCPGAPLARMELWIATETLLRHSRFIERDGAQPAERAAWPANGWRSLPIRLARIR